MPGRSFRLGGVDFEFDKSEPTESEQKALAKGFERDRAQLTGTSHKITVRAYASQPGTGKYNLELSRRRGVWLKNWLVAQGVEASRIQIRAMGEQDVYTRMVEAEPQADLDDPGNRVAFYEIETAVVEPEISEFAQMGLERADTQGEDRERGLEIFGPAIEPLADLIRQEVALPDNPFGDAPSDNLDELEGQVVDKLTELPKELLSGRALSPVALTKLAAKYVVGSWINVAISNLADAVRAARDPLYDALEQALGSIDDAYQPEIDGMSDRQLALYENLKSKLDAMSPLDRYCIGLYLVERRVQGILTGSPDVILRMLNGSNVASGASLKFQMPDYWYNNSYDEAGLEIVEKGGNATVHDPQHAEETPAGQDVGAPPQPVGETAAVPDEADVPILVDTDGDGIVDAADSDGDGVPDMSLPSAGDEADDGFDSNQYKQAEGLHLPDPDEIDEDVDRDGDEDLSLLQAAPDEADNGFDTDEADDEFDMDLADDEVETDEVDDGFDEAPV